ncbi:MAG: radical SAM protein [Acidobacteria bacterium]|nr:radical SAM protein [Acidobacteriota bacterium]
MPTNVSLVMLPAWGITDIPLTLASLVSYLRSKGVSVSVFDFNVELYHLLSRYRHMWDLSHGLEAWERSNFVDTFWRDNQAVLSSLIDDVLETKARTVGFSLFCSNRLLTERFAAALKQKAPEVRIAFGGPEVAYLGDVEAYGERFPWIDHFVLGDGEEALTRIARGEETRRIVNAREKPIRLDSLPLLDFSDFDFELYRDPHAFPMYSSRGCPNACIYCTERTFLGRYRTRSAERIFEDVRTQKERYGSLEMFRFQESTSNGNVRVLERFCDLMIEANLGLKWAVNNGMIRPEMDARLLAKLRAAGCVFFDYGLETPVASVLESAGKTLARGADFERIIRDTHDAGIEVAICTMFGLPGETDEDFQAQMDFLRRNHSYISVIAPSLWFCYFPEGSEGCKNPEKHGLDLDLGSLWWSTADGTNTYPMRMERFVRYTDLMQELGVQCIFGYPVLPDRLALLKEYYDELVRRGRMKDFEAAQRMTEAQRMEPRPAPGGHMLRNLLKKAIYKVAPAAIKGAIHEKARVRVLEKRLNRMLDTRTPPESAVAAQPAVPDRRAH